MLFKNQKQLLMKQNNLNLNPSIDYYQQNNLNLNDWFKVTLIDYEELVNNNHF